jgi:cysteine desulfurase/selenocysteine lyase
MESVAEKVTQNWRESFFDFDDAVYMDTATQGAIPRVAARAIEAVLELKKLPHLINENDYFELPARVRALLARMVGVSPEEIGLTTGASAGLAAVAANLDWEPGDEVLIARGEFPAQFCTWVPLSGRKGIQVKVVTPRGRFIAVEDFLAAAGPRTRLVSASLVRFDDGSLLDAARLAAGLRGTRAQLLLDVSQCVGALPMDLRALGADFAVAAGYKWLLGPYGTGFVWARQEVLDTLRPGPFYWMAADSSSDFSSLSFDPDESGKYAWKPPQGGGRWDSAETASFLQLAGVEASLEFLHRTGVETVRRHNDALLGSLVERLPLDRCVLASPSEASQRGPFLCVAARSPERTREIYARLRKEKIFVGLRNNALRISPYLYNTPEDIERLLFTLLV